MKADKKKAEHTEGLGFTSFSAHRLKRKRTELFEERQKLPILQAESLKRLKRILLKAESAVVVGPTGCGKSTQLPQLLDLWHNGRDSDDTGTSKKRAFRIAVSQPRRIAAMTVARRVAAEMGSNVGQRVGYHVRFDRTVRHHTVVTFLTDGMLLREAMRDQLLLRYDAVILDEAHERSLHTDVLFAIVKGIQKKRNAPFATLEDLDLDLDSSKSKSKFKGLSKTQKKKLKYRGLATSSSSSFSSSSSGSRGAMRKLQVIAMSATLEHRLWSDYLGGAPVIHLSPARVHKVVPLYLSVAKGNVRKDESHVDLSLISVMQAHIDAPFPGDFLCFVTSQEEIEHLCRALRDKSKLLPADAPKLLPLPLYSALPSHLQHRVFDQSNAAAAVSGEDEDVHMSGTGVGEETDAIREVGNVRRVIVATNIAETSVTIPNITTVIDSGKVKRRLFNPVTGVDLYQICNVSKAEAWQRCGRAGRIADGVCLRLYSESQFEAFEETMQPEIVRSNLRSVVLQCKALGISSIRKLDLMERPSDERLDEALTTLCMLGAINATTNELTTLGKQMAVFPLEPMLSRALLSEHSLKHCALEVMMLVSMLSVDSVFFTPRKQKDEAKERHAQFNWRIPALTKTMKKKTVSGTAAISDEDTKFFEGDDAEEEEYRHGGFDTDSISTISTVATTVNDSGPIAGDLMTYICVFRQYLERKLKASGIGSGHLDEVFRFSGLSADHSSFELSAESSSGFGFGFGSGKQYAAVRRWCRQNFLNEKALAKAHRVFEQLATLFQQNVDRDIPTAIRGGDAQSWRNAYEFVCRALIEGMMNHIAVLKMEDPKKKRSSVGTVDIGEEKAGDYVTYCGSLSVDIHPSSVLFGGMRALKPECVLYTSIVRTKDRTWLRDVLRIACTDWIDEALAKAKKREMVFKKMHSSHLDSKKVPATGGTKMATKRRKTGSKKKSKSRMKKKKKSGLRKVPGKSHVRINMKAYNRY